MNNFIPTQTDIKSLIHAINFLGKDLIGAEVGIRRAESFCTILQNCPNVKLLHGIDKWKPYDDYIKEIYDGSIAGSVSEQSVRLDRFIALNNIEFSGFAEKAIIHEGDCCDIVKTFEDNSLDFVFLDAYLTYEQILDDMVDWYRVVKPGGLFAGHDFYSNAVRMAVYAFRKLCNVGSPISIFDDVFVWKK